MTCIRMGPDCIVTVADAEGEFVDSKGRTWRFEFSRWGGPLWVRKNGQPLKNQCPPRRVWFLFDQWLDAWNAKQKESQP